MACKIYEQRIIAFIDILGWSDECKKESPRLSNASQIIHEAAENYSKSMKERAAAFGDATAYHEIHVAAMSDCLAVSVPDHHGYEIFKLAAYSCVRLLEYGFLTRGGITIGPLHHQGNVVFGPAMTEAVKLERVAVYPRLLCSRALLDHLQDFKSRDTSDDPQARRIVIDQLGSPIANLFSLATKAPGAIPPKEFVRQLWHSDTIEEIIRSQIARFSTGADRDQKIAEKWYYMQIVMKKMLDAFG